MNITFMLVSGNEYVAETLPNRAINVIHTFLRAEVLDTVNLRDGRVMMVDDLGHSKGLPVNEKATELYHGICKPGTTHQIVGDVAIVVDADLA